MAAADVTPADIARLIDDVKGRAPTAANDLLRFARRIFAFGVRRRIVPIQSGRGASRRAWMVAAPRSPAAGRSSLEELTQLFEKIRETRDFGGDNLLAVKLLLALCVRKGELLGARWEEFDLEGSTLRPVRSGICRPRAPRPATHWTFRSCPRWSSGSRSSRWWRPAANMCSRSAGATVATACRMSGSTR